jgi:hypothetical protein
MIWPDFLWGKTLEIESKVKWTIIDCSPAFPAIHRICKMRSAEWKPNCGTMMPCDRTSRTRTTSYRRPSVAMTERLLNNFSFSPRMSEGTHHGLNAKVGQIVATETRKKFDLLHCVSRGKRSFWLLDRGGERRNICGHLVDHSPCGQTTLKRLWNCQVFSLVWSKTLHLGTKTLWKYCLHPIS